MRFWTWQARDFLPTAGRVDWRKSRFWNDLENTPCIRLAYSALAQRLGTDQFDWSLTHRAEWPYVGLDDGCEWLVEAPLESALCAVRSSLWSKLIRQQPTEWTGLPAEVFVPLRSIDARAKCSVLLRHPLPADWIASCVPVPVPYAPRAEGPAGSWCADADLSPADKDQRTLVFLKRIERRETRSCPGRADSIV